MLAFLGYYLFGDRMIFKNLLLLSLTLPLSLQASDKIRAYFNHNELANYTEPYRGITRSGDNLEQIIIDQIKTAKSTLDIAIYDIDLPKVAQAIVARSKAGVKVRIVTDNTNNFEYKTLSADQVAKLPSHAQYEYKDRALLLDENHDGIVSQSERDNNDAIRLLNNNKIAKIDDTADGSTGSGIMHHKFVIIDGLTVMQASANFTISDVHGDMQARKTRGNQNSLVIVEDSNLAKLYQGEFEQLWNKKFGAKKSYRSAKTVTVGGKPITVQFSPSNSRIDWSSTTNGLIGETLEGAKSKVEMALFVFSEQKISNILESKSNDGVQVSALIEPIFAYREYSELLDMFGLAMPDTKCRYELDNNPWKTPSLTSGIPSLPAGDLLHHKFAVIDQSKVIMGSHNWSNAANTANDEALMVIENKSVANGYHQEHARLMKGAIIGAPSWLQAQANEMSDNCRTH